MFTGSFPNCSDRKALNLSSFELNIACSVNKKRSVRDFGISVGAVNRAYFSTTIIGQPPNVGLNALRSANAVGVIVSPSAPKGRTGIPASNA